MGITASSFSGLSDSTTYYFKVNGTEYSIITGTSPTYLDVCALMDAELQTHGFTAQIEGDAPDQDIKITNISVRGYGSQCVLDNGSTTPDLFHSMYFWSRFRKPPFYPYSRGSDALTIVPIVSIAQIRLSGSTTGATYFSYASSGTITLSGAASHTIQFTGTVSGGIVLSGTSLAEIHVAYAASGSAVLSGTSTFQIHIVFETYGGGVTAGGGAWWVTIHVVPIGGSTLGGAATTILYTAHFEYTASGSAILSGTSEFEVHSIYIASGALYLTGSPVFQIHIIFSTSGAAHTSGSALTQFYVEVGEPPYDPENPPPPPEYGTKMMYLSGSATFQIHSIYSGSGSSILSGTSSFTIHDIYEASGAAVLSGAAEKTFEMFVTATGGIILSGSATTSLSETIFLYTADVQAVLSGSPAFEIHIIFATSGGGVTAGGSAHTLVLAYVPVGTAVLSGAGSAEYNVQVGEPPYDPENPPPPPPPDTKTAYLSGTALVEMHFSFEITAVVILLAGSGEHTIELSFAGSGSAFSLSNTAWQDVGLEYQYAKVGDFTLSGAGTYFYIPIYIKTSTGGLVVAGVATTSYEAAGGPTFAPMQMNGGSTLGATESMPVQWPLTYIYAKSTVYDNKLVMAGPTGSIGYYDYDTTSWVAFDSGTGPTNDGGVVDFQPIVKLLVWSDNLIAVGADGSFGSFDGANWKYCDGNGEGTGPHGRFRDIDSAGTDLFGRDGMSCIADAIIYNNNLVMTDVTQSWMPSPGNFRIASYDGANWKAYNGTGDGTGPYFDRTISSYNKFSSLSVCGTNLIALEQNMAMHSYDGANWKYSNGTGTGTGPYNASKLTSTHGEPGTGTTTLMVYSKGASGKIYVLHTVNGHASLCLSSFDGTNWKMSDGSGTGSGPYSEEGIFGTDADVTYAGSCEIFEVDNDIIFMGKKMISSNDNKIRIASWDGANLHNYDASGGGSGMYADILSTTIIVGDSYPRSIFAAGKNEVYVVSRDQGDYGVASFDGTNWKYSDGNGSGSASYLTDLRPTIWLSERRTIATAMYDDKMVILTKEGISYYDFVGEAWSSYSTSTTGTTLNQTANDLFGENPMSYNEAKMIVYSTFLVIEYNENIVSWDGTNWVLSDGSGDGTGPYGYDVLGSGCWPQNMVVYGSHLLVVGYDGSYFPGVASYDGSNWKYADGTGTGTGIYLSGDNNNGDDDGYGFYAAAVLGTTAVFFTDSGSIYSYDTNGWQYPDGSGDGTGPYCISTANPLGDGTFISTSVTYNGSIVIGTNVANTTECGIASWDGTNWKYPDGTGAGTGPYRLNPFGGTWDTISDLEVVGTQLIVVGASIPAGSNEFTSGRVISFDGTNWKNWDGTGSGTGVYGSSCNIGLANIDTYGMKSDPHVLSRSDAIYFFGSHETIATFYDDVWHNYDGTTTWTKALSMNEGSVLGAAPVASSSILYRTENTDSIVYDNKQVYVSQVGTIAYYDYTTSKWIKSNSGIGPSNNGNAINYQAGVRLLVWGDNLVVLGREGALASYDGHHWKNWDGTGAGSGPGRDLRNIDGSGTKMFPDTSVVQDAIIFDNELVILSAQELDNSNAGLSEVRSISTFDGTNFKTYDGSGSGTGPYYSGDALGTRPEGGQDIAKFLHVVNSNLLVVNHSLRMSSYDGSNWKMYDGTGTGTGPYNNDQTSNTAGKIPATNSVGVKRIESIDNIIYAIHEIYGSSGVGISTFDGTAWKFSDGSGSGTGPYIANSALGTDIYQGEYAINSHDYIYRSHGAQVFGIASLGSNIVFVGYKVSGSSTFFSGTIDNIRIASFDGTNWKKYDSTGTGTGPYADRSYTTTFPGDSAKKNIMLISQGQNCITFSSKLKENFIASFDGTDWTNSDGTGGGSGQFTEDKTVFNERQCLVYDAAFYDNKLVVASEYGISYYSFVENKWYSYADSLGNNDELAQPTTNLSDDMSNDVFSSAQLLVWNNKLLLLAEGYDLSTWDGSNWIYHDGTGSGSGPYASDLLTNWSWAYGMVSYSTYLLVYGYSEAGYPGIMSWDGINWQTPDGLGSGTGPYLDGDHSDGWDEACGISHIGVLSNTFLAFSDFSCLYSYDGANWKYADGTGTGTGPYWLSEDNLFGYYSWYYATKAYNGSLLVSAMPVIAGGTNGSNTMSGIGSWDGTNWKLPDGTGTGTGPYLENAFGENCAVYKMEVIENKLIASGYETEIIANYEDAYFKRRAEKIISFDGTNWKKWDGTGTGTGPYNNGSEIGLINYYSLQPIVPGNKGMYLVSGFNKIASLRDGVWYNFDGSKTVL
jgi:hypothetical protein